MEYASEIMKTVVATICMAVGFEICKSPVLNKLSHIAERYILNLGKWTKSIAENCNRCDPVFMDLICVFRLRNIDLQGISDYMREVDIPFKYNPLPAFPVRHGSPGPNPLPPIPNKPIEDLYPCVIQPEFSEEVSHSRNNPTRTELFPDPNEEPAHCSKNPPSAYLISEPSEEVAHCSKNPPRTQLYSEPYEEVAHCSKNPPRIYLSADSDDDTSQPNSSSSPEQFTDGQTNISPPFTTFKVPNTNFVIRKRKKRSPEPITNMNAYRNQRPRRYNLNRSFNRAVLSEEEMFIMRKNIQITNISNRLKVLCRSSHRRVTRLLKMFVDFEAKVPSYCGTIARIEQPKANVAVLEYTDAVMQDIDVGYSVTVETSPVAPVQKLKRRRRRKRREVNRVADNSQNGLQCDTSNANGNNVAVNERLFRLMNENSIVPQPNHDEVKADRSEYQVIRSGPTSLTLKRSMVRNLPDKENNHTDLDQLEPSKKQKKSTGKELADKRF